MNSERSDKKCILTLVILNRLPIMRLHRHGTCEQLHRVSGGRREKILKIRVDSERGKRNIPPAEQLFAEFGFTVDNVVAKAQALLK